MEFVMAHELELLKEALDTIEKDQSPGGKADNMTLQDILKKHKNSGWKGTIEDLEDQVKMGIKVEMEHTTDPKLSQEIVFDHLEEIPDYYTRLDKMEKEGKGKE